MEKHKTGMKYVAYIYMSNFLVSYLKCYDTIATRYLEENGLSCQPEDPFFINSTGGPLYTAHSRPIDWSDFSLASGVPNVTTYTFRHKMSQVLTSQNKSILTECEEFALCHSANTRKQYYSDAHAEMAKSLMGQEVYSQMLAGEEDTDRATEKLDEVSSLTKERHMAQMRKMEEKTLEQMISTELELSKKAGGRRNVSYVRVALCDAIYQAGTGGDFETPINVTNVGDTLDLFFTNLPLRNKKNEEILLRLITIVPKQYWSINALQENLCCFAKQEMKKNQQLTIREVSRRWARKMLELLCSLQREKTGLTSPALMFILGNAMVHKGSSAYCMGNPVIAEQLRYWVLKEAAKQKKAQPKEILYQQEEEEEPEPEPQPEPGPVLPDQEEEAEPVPQPEPEPVLPDQVAQPTNKGKFKGLRVSITETLKCELLKKWCDLAPDPLAKDANKGKRFVTAQLKLMIKADPEISIGVGKDKVKLASIDLGNLANILNWGGLKNQDRGKGLLDFMTDHFAKIGKEANISLVRTERPKIVQAAIDKKNEAANYKPNPSRKKEEEAVVDHLTNRKKHLGRLDQFKPLFVSCLDEHGGPMVAMRDGIAKAEVYAFFSRPGHLLKEPFSQAEVSACIDQMCHENQLFQNKSRIYTNPR